MTLASSPPPVRVQLCGPTVFERAGERLEARLPGRQGRLLFAYLVLNRHRPIPRDELVDLLWPNELPSATDSALNSLISKLRTLCGAGTIEGRSSLRLRLANDVLVDVEVATEAAHRAESQIALGEWGRAWGPALVALITAGREFLPGDNTPWIDERRRDLEDVHARGLEAYAAASLGIGGTELPGAVRSARQLVRSHPLRESGYQLLMRSLAAQGNVAEALRVYSGLCDALRDELGVSPCESSQKVYGDLLAAGRP